MSPMLVGQSRYPPPALSRDTCHTTHVALCFVRSCKLSLLLLNNVQTACIVKGEAQRRPTFWRFSWGFSFSQVRLISRNSSTGPFNLIKSPILEIPLVNLLVGQELQMQSQRDCIMWALQSEVLETPPPELSWSYQDVQLEWGVGVFICNASLREDKPLRADFREGDEIQFSESGGSVNGPKLFTELPFL